MNRSRNVLILLFVSVLHVLPLKAEESPYHYISQETIPAEILPFPPIEGSRAWDHEIDAVRAAQRHISKRDILAMQDEQHLRLELMTSSLGEKFNRVQYPMTFLLLDRVLANTAVITEFDKRYWHTRRPYLTDKRIKLYVDHIDSSPGYPSGHTSETRVVAETLGMLDPERREKFRFQAEEIAWHRVMAGVHAPCDLEAGRLLALSIIGALLTNHEFNDDLANAREEIASHPFGR